MSSLRKHAGALAATSALAMAFVFLFSAAVFAQAVQVGVVNRNANLRAGPGTRYAIVGSAPAGTTVRIAATNRAGDWYHLSNGRWIAGFLVDFNGAGSNRTPIPPVAPTPVPAHLQPPQPAPRATGNRFVLVERRLWDVYENGGWLDGPSVHCGEARQLHVDVLDANGNRLNGVAVQVQYGAREIEVTGAQGKGDGVAEFVLGGGQDVRVVRDTDGSPTTSDMATGLSTNPANIAHSDLIAARYCQDEESCRQFAQNNGCIHHFSWNVTFQRR
jgi:hypothetical protein